MSKPTRWQAWRKRRGEFAYSKVDGCHAETKAACHTLLMETVELRGEEFLFNDLLILPEGAFPAAQTYKHRAMLPG